MGHTQTLQAFAQQKKPWKEKTEKTAYRMGKNNCKQCNPRRLNLQNIQTAHTTQQQNIHPNQKMDRRPQQTFLQRRPKDVQ